MSTPGFEVKVDVQGRHVSTLRPGASTEISVSGSAAGDSLQGNVRELEAQHLVVRLTSSVDVYVVFSDDATRTAADSSGMLFLKGTEDITMPEGTSYISVIAEDGASTGKFSATLKV